MLLEADAEAIQTQANASNISFVTQLVQSKKFSALQLAEFAAHSFGFPILDLSALDTEHLPKDVLDIKIVQKHRVLPLLKRGNRLFIAISDPTNLQALDDVKFQTSQTVDPVVVEDDKLGKLLEKFIESSDTSLKSIDTEDLDLDITDDESFAQRNDAASAAAEVDDAPVVRYLQKILMDAINGGVSDIHFEPYEKFYVSAIAWTAFCMKLPSRRLPSRKRFPLASR